MKRFVLCAVCLLAAIAVWMPRGRTQREDDARIPASRLPVVSTSRARVAETAVAFSASTTDDELVAALGQLIATASTQSTRAEALQMLAANFPPDAWRVRVVARIAITHADLATRAAAIDALEAWLTPPTALQEAIALAIVQAINASATDELRGRGIGVLAMQEFAIPGRLIRALPVPALAAEPEYHALYASVLGKADLDTRDFALEHLQRSFETATEREARATYASHMLRLGGEAALDRLRRLDGCDPLFIEQLEAYLRTLSRGE
jgi:hypothetical protein